MCDMLQSSTANGRNKHGKRCFSKRFKHCDHGCDVRMKNKRSLFKTVGRREKSHGNHPHAQSSFIPHTHTQRGVLPSFLWPTGIFQNRIRSHYRATRVLWSISVDLKITFHRGKKKKIHSIHSLPPINTY